jgi:hypothetical protein
VAYYGWLPISRRDFDYPCPHRKGINLDINWSLIKSSIEAFRLWVTYSKLTSTYAEIHLQSPGYKAIGYCGYKPFKNEIGLMILEHIGQDNKTKMPVFMTHSDLEPEFQNRGIGLLLYLLGAEQASKLNGFIVPASTVRFETSFKAHKVWKRLIASKIVAPQSIQLDIEPFYRNFNDYGWSVHNIKAYHWASDIKLIPTIIGVKRRH